MATCTMMTALCVVLMWPGAILELGVYIAPLFAGLCLIPIGLKYGKNENNRHRTTVVRWRFCVI